MLNITISSIKRRPFPQAFFYWGMLFLMLFGWLVDAVTSLSADGILEVYFALLGLIAIAQHSRRVQSTTLRVATLIFIYITAGMFISVALRGANILDFLMAYKFTWYLLILSLFYARPVSTSNDIYKILRASLVMFFLVYFGKVALGNPRPTFFTENNFELMLLSLLYIACSISPDKPKTLDTILILLIAAASGSRSGSALIAVAILFSFDFKQAHKTKNLLLLSMGLIGVAAAVYVFSQRSGTASIEDIDRYRFLQSFLISISDWGVLNYLFGAERISALPQHVCSSLSYYNTLNSFKGDGTCYSVILHSFNLRIIYDHGIILTVATLFVLWQLLGRCPIKYKICVLTLLFLNGLSVSSINSVYGALGVACIMFSSSLITRNSPNTENHNPLLHRPTSTYQP
ncbi:hypothetical protein SAMN05216271_0111 [Halopseudomonas sabulinigri]|uniref:Uncharacterized protein n=1 Tax=Halopseudomonas sabulinigri TaxID=472181 RepID=A0A1H1L8P7_9GAMM|nr:hypothetical protein [Halopseudomonas sabulinigri]SDR70672.1 hypothetical protein SAMN05216271_0111 [Halopseudomonas sabulinigri]